MSEIRSNILKVTPNYEDRCLIIGENKVINEPLFIENYTTDIPRITSIFPSGNVCRGKGNKTFNKSLTEQLGMPPTKWKKVYNYHAYRLWVDPVKWYSDRLARGYRGRINTFFLKDIWKNKETLDQAVKDGIENVIPILLQLEMDPKQAKEFLGRGPWKKISHNSFHRNQLISTRILSNSKKSNVLLEIPSTALENINFQSGEIEFVKWACDNRDTNLKNYYNIRSLERLCKDTHRMAQKTGEPFDFGWSRRRMMEEHDRLSKIISERKYGTQPFSMYNKIGDLVCEENGWTAVYLKSPAEVAHEGQKMRHCVASYVDMCHDEYLLIISIRDPSGVNYSTLALKVRPFGIYHDDVEIIKGQHYCACNRRVENDNALNLANKIADKTQEILNERT